MCNCCYNSSNISNSVAIATSAAAAATMRHTDDTLTASYVNSNAICLAIVFPPIFFSSAGSVAANEYISSGKT